MTEGATTVSCIDETTHHKSSLAPDESIEMPALRNTSIVDVHIQEKHEQVIDIRHISLHDTHTQGIMCRRIKTTQRGQTHLIHGQW